MKLKFFFCFFSALSILALAFAEKKAARPAAKARITFHIRHVFNGEPLRFEDVRLRDRGGNTFSISRLAYLVSDVALIRADGTETRLENSLAYLNPAEQRDSFALNGAEMGHYSGVTFRIGLGPKINHADPAAYPGGHPLNPLTNGLHWGWQGGYVFLALEGRYEQAGARLGGFSYHLGTDANLMRVTLRKDFTLTQDSELNLRFDVEKIFDAVTKITIRGDGGDSTHSAAGDLLAQQLKTNVERSFTLTGVAPLSASPVLVPEPKARLVFPPHTTPYPLVLPAHFPQPTLLADNPLTKEGVALGEKLFVEKKLSGNNTESCAACHQERYALSDGGKALSRGISGKLGSRNAPSLYNMAWNSAFTWDGRRTRLRDQALAPIQDGREMRQSLPQTVAKLRRNPAYRARFARAFGSPGITAERVGLAIEQYLLTRISADSKFDRALRGAAQFTDEEKQGLFLFITEYNPAREQYGADCFHCHGGNLFTDNRFTNNGLAEKSADSGRYMVTHQDFDRDKFKTPSLRNVELTAPYMHDGRLKTLEAVIEHYNSGVHRSATLDPNLAKHLDTGLHLSHSDKKALVAFLKTLTDERLRRVSPRTAK